MNLCLDTPLLVGNSVQTLMRRLQEANPDCRWTQRLVRRGVKDDGEWDFASADFEETYYRTIYRLGGRQICALHVTPRGSEWIDLRGSPLGKRVSALLLVTALRN